LRQFGGAVALIANRDAVVPWEKFVVVDAGNGNIALRAVANNQYVCFPTGASVRLCLSTYFVN
jgi:hypothetical protein